MNGMVYCNGCGFHVERKQVVEWTEYTGDQCDLCAKCEAQPLLRESYRRGFNAGLDAMVKAMVDTAAHSNLRKCPTRP